MEHAVLAAQYLAGPPEPRAVDLGAQPEQRAVRDPERAHRWYVCAPGQASRIRALGIADVLRALPGIRPCDALSSHDYPEPVVHLRARGPPERCVPRGTESGESG